MLIGLIALMIAAAFTGAAFYINFAEHPARMAIPTEPAVLQWRPAYHRGVAMQGGLAVAGGLCALWQGFALPDAAAAPFLLAGGAALLANWPYTLLVILPVNRKLEADGAEHAPESAALLRRWNRLHAGRTLLGLLATAMLLTAASS